MVEKNENSGANILSFKTPETRFPRAAVDYVDALLTVQRDRFTRELAAYRLPSTVKFPPRPKSAQIFANSDDFVGTGWTDIGTRRDGTAFRWMGRIGTLMVPIDLSEPRAFALSGCGFTKRRFLKETTLWIEDRQIDYTLSRRGFNRWTFSGEIPVLAPRPYYLLRIQSPGLARLAEGVDAFVSLAVSELNINC
ncbi:MAG: hypothetical protein JKY60_10800 [Kordiimonadaceae bacterium]|nr:hypothetical protein [Kordiimonadaceae bacterium]